MIAAPNAATPPFPDEFAELEALAVSLARGAGEVARAGREQALAVDTDSLAVQTDSLVVQTKSTATDLVTEVDRASEAWLVARLAEARPHDDVLGEEGTGHERPGGARVRWVVDPIDGTVNFVLGLPDYAVSVAAEVDGRVVAGAVRNPTRGETFHARLGGGAFLVRDGQPALALHGPRDVPLARAVVATGFAYDAATRARQIAVVSELLPRIADIRRIGAAALDLCNVAAGRVDAYFEVGLHRWDYAAGALVVQEAGGVVTGPADGSGFERFLTAAGPGLAAELTRVLVDLGADAVR